MSTTINLDDIAEEIISEVMGTSGGTAEEALPPESDFDDTEIKENEEVQQQEGYELYSKLFGWDNKVLGKKEGEDGKHPKDFFVKTFKEADWSEESKYYIPDINKFKDRVVDHSVMYPFVLGMQEDESGTYDKVMLVGPTGSGKSTMVEFYCAKIKHPFFRINGRQDMESDAIIGRPWVEDGTMHFHKGEIPKAMEEGWMVLFDEPWKTPSGIWMTLQRAMERGGILQIDDMPGTLADKQIIPDPRHRLVLADNVVGTGDNTDKYGATLIQDSSTLNRIDMVLQVPYLSEKVEVALIKKKFSKLKQHRVEHMIRVLNLLRKGFDQGELSSPASLRNVEAWARKAQQIRNYAEAFRWVLLNRYSEESERNAVRQFFFDVFGERL